MPAESPGEFTHRRWLSNARWLARLRWVAVVGQLTTIAVAVSLVGVELQVFPLLSLVAMTAATNAWFTIWLKRPQHTETPGELEDRPLAIAGVLALDLLALSGLLYFTGGLGNPFAVFYFVNLSLAAVILPTRWAWGLAGLAALCLAGLTIEHVTLTPWLNLTPEHPGQAWAREVGLLVAFVTCSGVVTYFVTRVSRELRQRESELRSAEQRRARSERVEALATLAAGAGHELASPLSTIAVIAKDLSRHLEGCPVPETVLEDVALIRSELDQCRRILDGMASAAGQVTGESLRPVEVEALLAAVFEGIRRRNQVQVVVADQAKRACVVVPLAAVTQALRGLVRNALDASAFGEAVEVTAQFEQGVLTIAIRDRGTGMPPEVLQRAGDPFFTTKDPGQGMGLGLFLARNVIERLGGDLQLQSTPGTGTLVRVRLPVGR